MTPGNREIVERHNVMTTMTKYAVDAEGMIALHGGHTVSDSEDWEQVFEGPVRR